MIATLTTKGQVTLPKELRDALGLQPGDKLDFVLHDDHLLEVIPMKQPARKLRGLLPKPARAVSVEQMNTAIAQQAVTHGRD
jgi:AbrB family looped-hinge helix DNA binding protein